jgi:hypothetical protein
MVGEVPDSHFENHLHGTFTGAKERIAWAGRAQSAAGYVPPPVRKKNSVPLKEVVRKRQRPARGREDCERRGCKSIPVKHCRAGSVGHCRHGD